MNSNRARILITDTDYSKLRKLRNTLIKNAYEIFIADNIEKFSFLLKSYRFDLILLDLSIPDIKPLNVVDSFNDGDLYTAIISVGDPVNYDIGIETVRRGAFDFLIKPYKANVLLQLIVSALDNSVQIKQEKHFSLEIEPTSNIYQFMIENSQDIHYALDHEGRFTYINKRVESLLGYDRTELIGEHYSKILHEEDLERANYRLHNKRRNGLTPQSVELRFKCKNNNEKSRYFDVNSTSIPHTSNRDGNSILNKQSFSLEDITSFAVARDVSERKKIERIIERKASHDHLTGLPNKTLFYDRFKLAIARAKRNEETFAVMFLDLDDFKNINDVYGHRVGDNVLQAMSARMQKCLRESDTLARVGGDEFTLLLPEVNNLDEVILIAEKLTTAINKSFSVGGKNQQLSVSIGIAIYPNDGVTRESLVHRADQAMYQIKHEQKNGYRFFAKQVASE